MTVLIPPRIYFSGATTWNVATGNNNDQWPTYDFPVAELNFDYLKTQQAGGRALTREYYLSDPNAFRKDFKTWVLTLQTYTQQNSDGSTTSWQQMPSEWNYWGGNTSQFLQSVDGGATTTVSGGQLVYGTDPSNPPVVSDDPLVGLPIQIVGDTRPTQTAPRLVDINPDAFWASQIYLGGVQIGDPTDQGSPYLSGHVPEGMRMHSRWINFQRNLNEDGKVEIAGVGGCFFQIGLPATAVTINNPGGSSRLLAHLQNALRSAAVQGVQLRFAAYLTKYWSSEEILKEIPSLEECLECSSKRPTGDGNYVNDLITCQYEKLLAFWNKYPGKSNKAVTKIAGTVGVWDNDEPSTAPWQRYLPSVIDPAMLAKDYAPNPLGCSDAWIDSSARILALDLGNTIPETSSSGEKYDLGDLQVGIDTQTGYFPVATLAPPDYATDAYLKTAGIVDMRLPAGVPTEGRVVIKAQEKYVYRGSSSSDLVVAASESRDQLVVQTDQRGVYVEQHQLGSMSFDVLYNGPPPRNRIVYVTIAQYLPLPIPPGANGGAWQRVGSTLEGQDEPRAPVAYFPTPGGPVQVITAQVQLDGNGYGRSSFSFVPIDPGYPTYVFFPHFDLSQPPVLPTEVKPVAPGLTTLNAFYGCVRILPFDDALPREFAELWNATHDEDQAYRFVDQQIFAVYAMIYPVMEGVVGSKQSLIDNNPGIQERTSAVLRDNTGYMPVTRELSAGKRQVIGMWGQLVDNGFDPAFNFPISGLSRTVRTDE